MARASGFVWLEHFHKTYINVNTATMKAFKIIIIFVNKEKNSSADSSPILLWFLIAANIYTYNWTAARSAASREIQASMCPR